MITSESSKSKRNESGSGLRMREIEKKNGLILRIIETIDEETPRRERIGFDKME